MTGQPEPTLKQILIGMILIGSLIMGLGLLEVLGDSEFRAHRTFPN